MKKRILQAVLIAGIVIALAISNGYIQNRLLFNAIKRGDYESSQRAIQHGAFINMPRYLVHMPNTLHVNPTPLITACKGGNQDIIELLINNGADINKADSFCYETPLLAALHGKKENRFALGLYMIEHGADIYATQSVDSVLYRSLLVLESDSEQTITEGFQVFQYLASNNVEMTLPYGKNALTFAAQYHNYNAVRYLIENSYYDVNECDNNGDTALISAAKYSEKDIVELLLCLGADKKVTDVNGKTAFDYAIENNDEALIDLLRN